MFRYSVISLQWDVVRQQWLGGTAEWSDFLSMALSLLGNRLAPRLRTSPFRWPQTWRQKWGMGMGTVCCQNLLSVKVQAWFISMLLNSLWLCHFFLSLAIVWAGCHDSSHSLSVKDAVYWEPVMSMHRYAELLGPIQAWSLIWVRWKKLLVCVNVCEDPKLVAHLRGG